MQVHVPLDECPFQRGREITASLDDEAYLIGRSRRYQGAESGYHDPVSSVDADSKDLGDITKRDRTTRHIIECLLARRTDLIQPNAAECNELRLAVGHDWDHFRHSFSTQVSDFCQLSSPWVSLLTSRCDVPGVIECTNAAAEMDGLTVNFPTANACYVRLSSCHDSVCVKELWALQMQTNGQAGRDEL